MTAAAAAGWTAGIPTGHAIGVSRAATLRRCPTCGTVTLVGLDHDTAALVTICDTVPLDPIAEVAAICDGRTTYDAVIAGYGDQVHLEHRHAIRIAAPRRWTVLPIHVCPGAGSDLSWLPSTPSADDLPEEPAW